MDLILVFSIIAFIFGVIMFALGVEYGKRLINVDDSAIADPLKDKVFIEKDELNNSLF